MDFSLDDTFPGDFSDIGLDFFYNSPYPDVTGDGGLSVQCPPPPPLPPTTTLASPMHKDILVSSSGSVSMPPPPSVPSQGSGIKTARVVVRLHPLC